MTTEQTKLALSHSITGDGQGLRVSFHYHNGETIVRLLEPIKYRLHLNNGMTVSDTIPEGFISDGCSLPRFFWRTIGHPFDSRYLKEAIWHDWLYWNQHSSRLFADAIFHDALLQRTTISKWKINAIILALRCFGWIAWLQNKKAKDNDEIKIFM